MSHFVQVAVNVPSVAGVFDYAIPTELAEAIGIGHLVIVPFGKQTVQGVVLHFVGRPSVAETKHILEILDPEPVLTSTQIELAEWMAEATLSPLAAIINMMIPAGLSQQADVSYALRNVDAETQTGAGLSQINAHILKLLHERGPLRGRQIETQFRNVDWRKSAEWLVRHGVLEKKSVLPPTFNW